MGILEQTIKMKEEGIPEQDIIDELSRQGISPREINDTLRQAQIKSAVSSEESAVPSPEDTYQPSAYQEQQYAPQEQYIPQPQEYQVQEQQQYYQPGGYEQYASSGMDADTVMEIAEQVFSEKMKKPQKLLDATSEAAIVLQSKMENISERLKKIENMIDKLQIAILEKVGSYGRNLESVKKEMSMMQDSFSKMVSHPRKEESEKVSRKKSE